MNKKEEAGVYQLDNGNWAFRYIVTVEGKQKVRRRTKNEFGKPFKSKASALKAKQQLQKQDIIQLTKKKPSERCGNEHASTYSLQSDGAWQYQSHPAVLYRSIEKGYRLTEEQLRSTIGR